MEVDDDVIFIHYALHHVQEESHGLECAIRKDREITRHIPDQGGIIARGKEMREVESK